MTEKRYRIEFTVNVHNEGVTKDWDWSDDDIKNFALQELDCMSPAPVDITFSEIGSPWHTGLPTEEGWYLVATKSIVSKVPYQYGVAQWSDVYGWCGLVTSNVFSRDIVAYQKIEPYKEG